MRATAVHAAVEPQAKHGRLGFVVGLALFPIAALVLDYWSDAPPMAVVVIAALPLVVLMRAAAAWGSAQRPREDGDA